MTQALCLRCGHIKFGAFLECQHCHSGPTGSQQLDILFSDHTIRIESLRQLGAFVQALRAASEEPPVRFWALLRFLSEHPSSLLRVVVPPEFTDGVTDLLTRVPPPPMALELAAKVEPSGRMTPVTFGPYESGERPKSRAVRLRSAGISLVVAVASVALFLAAIAFEARYRMGTTPYFVVQGAAFFGMIGALMGTFNGVWQLITAVWAPREVGDRVTIEHESCPVCGAQVEYWPRYPRYVCATCSAEAVSPDGRPVAFFDSPTFRGVYRDTGAACESDECVVRGVRCRAQPAHFGGVVIVAEPAEPATRESPT